MPPATGRRAARGDGGRDARPEGEPRRDHGLRAGGVARGGCGGVRPAAFPSCELAVRSGVLRRSAVRTARDAQTCVYDLA